MAQASDQIRGEIGETRERLGETVDALAYKANVPKRTKNWLGEKKDAVTGAVSGHTPDGPEVKQQMSGMKRTAEQNPLGLAIAGAAAGFLAGLLAPSTRVEDERLGPMADEVKATAADAGREAVERGKDVARESGQAAMETAKERGREESQELSASLQDKAHEVTGSQETTAETTPTATSRSV
jgi:gas vesicle protein